MHILILIFWSALSFAQLEADLEKRAAHYLDKGEWQKAEEIARILCQKEVTMGCTILGSSLLGQKKYSEASTYFNRACDKFEPYACRSLGRFLSKGNEPGLSTIYFKRACHYGLKEMCNEVKESKQWYSPAALFLIENFRKDCRDTQTQACKDTIARVDACEKPLTKQDCLMVAGYFSIYLRAKLLQSEALTRLFALQTAQAAHYMKAKPSSYTYDLQVLMRGTKPVERLNYVFGFMQGCGKKYVKKKNPQTHSQMIWPNSYKELSARTIANVLEYFKKGKGEDCYPVSAGFEAYAVASLDPLNPTHLDVWKIDQDKRIEHVQDGLPLP